VWIESPEIAAPAFGVNGAAFDGADAIYAVSTTAGTLYRIAITDPKLSPVSRERPLAAPDGIRIPSSGRAIVVEQGTGSISKVDFFTGAIDIRKEGLRGPTSLDLIGSTAWVSEGQLSHLFDMTTPGLPFEVVRVPL
jgi:hypothetical protein